jgi:two-component system nitrate/nitrite response regulator NarL
MDLANIDTDLCDATKDCRDVALLSPGEAESLPASRASGQTDLCPAGATGHRRAAILGKHRLFLDSLREMLGKGGVTVIGKGDTIPRLLHDLRAQPIPELVICHIGFDRPLADALDLIGDARRHFATPKIVVLADAATTEFLSGVVEADVHAILLTSISGEMLLRSLEFVLSGHCLFPSAAMRLLAKKMQAPASDDAAPTDRPTPQPKAVHPTRRPAPLSAPDPDLGPMLSGRELQVIDCLMQGWSNKQIARELDIVEATVKVYLKALMRKLGASNRTQLAIWALSRVRPAVMA